MHNLSLRTAILKRSSFKIAVGEVHSPVPGRREQRDSRERDIDCNADCNRDRRGTSESNQGFLQPYGIWQPCFLRVGSPTKTFHERTRCWLTKPMGELDQQHSAGKISSILPL